MKKSSVELIATNLEMMVDQLALPNLANDDGTIKTRSKNHDKSQQDGKSIDIDTILQVF